MVTVIIPTMNRPESLQDAIEGLRKSTKLPDEIVIVDQTNIDHLLKDVKLVVQKSKLKIKYYHLDKASLTGARNFALSKANNDIVVFMDDDVLVAENTVEEVERIMEDQSISMIGGLDYYAKEDTKLGYLFGTKSFFKKKQGGYVTSAMYGRYPLKCEKEMSTQWAMGFFFVIRKHLVYDFCLSWEERFISYGYPEDLDFSHQYYRKSIEKGYRCIITPRVCVFHNESKEWRETSYTVTCMKIVNREYLTYKFNWSSFSRLSTRWSNFGLLLYRIYKNDKPLDVIKAQWLCDCYRRDIKKGLLHTELYK